MENIENQDAVLEETLDATPEEEVPEIVEEEAPQEEVQEPVEEEQQDTRSTINFKNIRKSLNQKNRENDLLRAQLEVMKQQQPYPQQQQQQQPPQQDYSVAPDDLVEGKHLSKYDNEIKSLRNDLAQYQQQTMAMTTETRLKAQYRDFDSVVTKENIEMLKAAHPEIAATLESSPDLYNKAVSAYTMIKNLGIIEAPAHAKNRNIAQSNASKPRPVTSVKSSATQDSPLSQATAFADKRMTKELQEELIREMNEAKMNS